MYKIDHNGELIIDDKKSFTTGEVSYKYRLLEFLQKNGYLEYPYMIRKYTLSGKKCKDLYNFQTGEVMYDFVENNLNDFVDKYIFKKNKEKLFEMFLSIIKNRDDYPEMITLYGDSIKECIYELSKKEHDIVKSYSYFFNNFSKYMSEGRIKYDVCTLEYLIDHFKNNYYSFSVKIYSK